eukprot:9502755-Pyramimonas_sp.AAC.1
MKRLGYKDVPLQLMGSNGKVLQLVIRFGVFRNASTTLISISRLAKQKNMSFTFGNAQVVATSPNMSGEFIVKEHNFLYRAKARFVDPDRVPDSMKNVISSVAFQRPLEDPPADLLATIPREMPPDGNEMWFLTNDGEPFVVHPRTNVMHIPVGRLPGGLTKETVAEKFPIRIVWVKWNTSPWQLLENRTDWTALQNPEESLGAHGILLTAFTAKTETRGNSD